jgi:hypothetical protein
MSQNQTLAAFVRGASVSSPTVGERSRPSSWTSRTRSRRSPPIDDGHERIEPIAASDLSFIEESQQLLAASGWRTGTTTNDDRR